MRQDRDRLRDILEAIERIERHAVKGRKAAQVSQAKTVLKRQIETTHQRTDQSVYELYGLTEDGRDQDCRRGDRKVIYSVAYLCLFSLTTTRKPALGWLDKQTNRWEIKSKSGPGDR